MVDYKRNGGGIKKGIFPCQKKLFNSLNNFLFVKFQIEIFKYTIIMQYKS